MKMYEKSILIDIIEAKLLDAYPEYYPQNQYNNFFITYLHKYLKDNTYVGMHSDLYIDLNKLKDLDDTLTVKESTDKQTYTLTSEKDMLDSSFNETLILLLQKYNNYDFIVKSSNRIVIKVKFGCLPQTASSWLNLLNNETIIDYYIDGITLVKNTHKQYGGAPDSGYVCFRITNVKEYDNIMFIIKESQTFDESDVKFTFATLLTELEGSEGATLNRIIEDKPMNTYYAIGPYKDSYISSEKASLIIQVPYKYAISESYSVFNVTNSVIIKNTNNIQDKNNKINYFVPLDIHYYEEVKTEEDYINLFSKYEIDSNNVVKLVNSDTDIFSDTLVQYIFGDFIWKTSDSKLIAYLQNLVSSLYGINIIPNGIWSDELSKYILKFKTKPDSTTVFIDDIVDKNTEEQMTAQFKLNTNMDPNTLFNEW